MFITDSKFSNRSIFLANVYLYQQLLINEHTPSEEQNDIFYRWHLPLTRTNKYWVSQMINVLLKSPTWSFVLNSKQGKTDILVISDMWAPRCVLHVLSWWCLLYTLETALRVPVTSRFHQPDITDQQYKAVSGAWTQLLVRQLPLQLWTVREKNQRPKHFCSNTSQTNQTQLIPIREIMICPCSSQQDISTKGQKSWTCCEKQIKEGTSDTVWYVVAFCN